MSALFIPAAFTFAPSVASPLLARVDVTTQRGAVTMAIRGQRAPVMKEGSSALCLKDNKVGQSCSVGLKNMSEVEFHLFYSNTIRG